MTRFPTTSAQVMICFPLLLTMLMVRLGFPFSTNIVSLPKNIHRASKSEILESAQPNMVLPPGRPTRRPFNVFFDDSMRLLNPKTMGTYQVDRSEQFGPIFKTNIFFSPAVVCTSDESLQMLGKEESKKDLRAYFPPHHRKLFGENSLLVISGEEHNRLRQLMQPSLSPTAIETYRPLIQKEMGTFLNDLVNEKEAFAVVPKLREFFVSIALKVLLGTDKHMPTLAEDLKIWSRGLVSAPLTRIPWSVAARALRARRRIVETFKTLLEADRASPTGFLLTKLIQSNMTDSEIIDNVLTLVFAGSDTTASAATSLWMAHSQGNATDVSTVLQQNPPAPFTMRQTHEQLKLNAYTVPKNWLVIYGIYPSNSSAFGAGPRRCPGRYLANMELEILDAALKSFTWYLVKGQNLEKRYSPGYFPVDGLMIENWCSNI